MSVIYHCTWYDFSGVNRSTEEEVARPGSQLSLGNFQHPVMDTGNFNLLKIFVARDFFIQFTVARGCVSLQLELSQLTFSKNNFNLFLIWSITNFREKLLDTEKNFTKGFFWDSDPFIFCRFVMIFLVINTPPSELTQKS